MHIHKALIFTKVSLFSSILALNLQQSTVYKYHSRSDMAWTWSVDNQMDEKFLKVYFWSKNEASLWPTEQWNRSPAQNSRKKSFHIFSTKKNSGDLRRSLKFFTSLFWKLGKRGNMSSAEIYWSGDKPSRGRTHVMSWPAEEAKAQARVWVWDWAGPVTWLRKKS